MEKIKSFTVDHLYLPAGIYLSRQDNFGETSIVTYDLRMTRPNAEPVLNTAEIHTIEHLGATFLRNREGLKQDVVYFGPMGCRTGFYLLLANEHDPETMYELVKDMLTFIIGFSGEIPGNSASECGNYLDHNLPMAKVICRRYLDRIMEVDGCTLDYLSV